MFEKHASRRQTCVAALTAPSTAQTAVSIEVELSVYTTWTDSCKRKLEIIKSFGSIA